MKFLIFTLYICVTSLMSLMAQDTFAHARLTANGNIPPRSAGAGLKAAPCGGVAKTTTPKVLKSGATVQVDWEETIDHPGRFEFYLSNDGDQNWFLLKTVNDNQGRDLPLPHKYSTTLIMPSGECKDCTLQMIQVMTENPASPTNYYSCADIELTMANVPPALPLPTPPLESPSTPETCH